MGWYTTGLQTALTQNTWGQPYSIFARKDFTIDSLEGYTKAVINVRVDDGAVVYVNGKEVKRTNLATSYTQVPWNAKATKAVSNAEGAIPMTFEIPASALSTGKNTIAVQEHGNSVFYNGVSFDLSATLQP
ncbi:MAG: hypothetical protein Q3974_08785 [Rothia sp. (in: high G+C Gram-positive bacteria)]|nr:hypothetical protein [Rothia sp. (in: high G+C Gram-positive bacteria)]